MPSPYDISRIVQVVVECSVYLDPTDPGLSYDELVEACSRLDLRAGEVGDAIPLSGVQVFVGTPRIHPSEMTLTSWKIYAVHPEPDYRNFEVFDFIALQFNDLVRDVGQARARIDRQVLVERGRAAGLPERDLQAALTILTMSEQLTDAAGVLGLPRGHSGLPVPSQQRQGLARANSNPLREQAYAAVKGVIERRTDGRSAQAEPLDAFADRLTDLGHGAFRVWWVQTISEMRRCDPQVSPVSLMVLAAATIEGALAFIVRHGREQNLSVFKSSDLAKPPRSWRIDDLINSAAQGHDAILDHAARHRAAAVMVSRQRIHAGRMLEDYPGGVPDLRPEEARDALATAELVVRKILDWLDRHPPQTPSG